MNKEKPLLFVYGTLQENDSVTRVSLANVAEKVDDATYNGLLYWVRSGEFPAAVPSNNKKDVVKGQVFRLINPNILRELDWYESCPDLFKREKVDVQMSNGGVVRPFIYLFQQPTDDLELIPSGDFLEFKESLV